MGVCRPPPSFSSLSLPHLRVHHPPLHVPNGARRVHGRRAQPARVGVVPVERGERAAILARGAAARFGVVSMCIGSGMGAAAVFERGAEGDPYVNAAPVRGKHNLLSVDAVV